MRKINFYLSLFFLLISLYIQGKENHIQEWEFNALDFEYDMGIHASLSLNGAEIINYEEMELVAFCQEECRGIALVQSKNGIPYYELRIYSNQQEGEIISFRSIDKTTGKEYPILQTLTFDGEHHGTLSDLFELNAFTAVEGITLNESAYTINTQEQLVLIPTIFPEDAWNKNVLWESSDETIATVDITGNVSTLKAGFTTITATTQEGGFKATCEITVLQPVTGILLSEDEITIVPGEEKNIIATILPEDASNKSLHWSSSDENIATINQEGMVKGITPGEAFITVVTGEGNFSATCSVLVLQPVTGIILDKTELTLEIGESYTLLATIFPENASNKSIYWSSNNEETVTVSQQGEVEAIKQGTALITVTTEDGSYYANCEITVIEKGVGIRNDKLEAVSVYPTLVDDYLIIKDLPLETIITVTNINGETIYSEKEINQSVLEISCSNWSSGVYLVHLQSVEENLLTRILKR